MTTYGWSLCENALSSWGWVCSLVRASYTPIRRPDVTWTSLSVLTPRMQPTRAWSPLSPSRNGSSQYEAVSHQYPPLLWTVLVQASRCLRLPLLPRSVLVSPDPRSQPLMSTSTWNSLANLWLMDDENPWSNPKERMQIWNVGTV